MLLRRFWWVGVLGLGMILLWPQHTPTIAQTESNDAILIWWPQALYTDESRLVMDDLFISFNNTSSIQISPRIYLASHNGLNIVGQLSLVNSVAPNALPDVMLVRRDDMAALLQQTSTLSDPSIYSQQPATLKALSAWDTLSLINEFTVLSPALVSMGEANNILYGLPYLVELQHTLYRPTVYDQAPTTTESLLLTEEPLLFAARPSSSQVVNDFILTLYVNAGGTFINAEGAPTLNPLPLRQTLLFIEAASAAQLIGNNLLIYRSIQDYIELLDDADSFALVDSSVYLNIPELASFTVGAVPAINQNQVVLMDGWVWVLLTDDPVRQVAAYQFVKWMFETDQIVDVATAVQSIPVQERALNAMNDPYYETVQLLFADTVFVRGRRNQAAVALQVAFEAVLNGASADEAATAALNSIESADDGS